MPKGQTPKQPKKPQKVELPPQTVPEEVQELLADAVENNESIVELVNAYLEEITGSMQPYVTPDVLSYDGGNGFAVTWRIENGKAFKYQLPNARARLSGYEADAGAMGLPVENAMKVTINEGVWGVGEGIWELTEYPIQTNENNEKRYGSEQHIMMCLVNAVLSGIKSGSEISLVVSAPPGLVEKVKPIIIDTFSKGNSADGWWIFSVAGKEYALKFTKVVVISEGVGAYAAYAWDWNGNEVKIPGANGRKDMLTGRVKIADIGKGTFDLYTIINGKLSSESILHATDPQGGVLTHLVKPLGDYITTWFKRSELPDPKLSTAHIDYMLRKWAAGGMTDKSGTFLISNVPFNINPKAQILRQQFAQWVVSEKLEPRVWGDRADTLLVDGGGWLYILDLILAEYPNKPILLPEHAPHLGGFSIMDLNSFGALALVANQRQSRAKKERTK